MNQAVILLLLTAEVQLWVLICCLDIHLCQLCKWGERKKVPLSSSRHHFCLLAQVDWDLVQDVVDCLMLLPCFQFLTALKICSDACSPPWGARLELFLFQILFLSSLLVHVHLRGSDVEFRLAECLWNYLKCLYNLLLNFGYCNNTARANSFIWSAKAVHGVTWAVLLTVSYSLSTFGSILSPISQS